MLNPKSKESIQPEKPKTITAHVMLGIVEHKPKTITAQVKERRVSNDWYKSLLSNNNPQLKQSHGNTIQPRSTIYYHNRNM